MIKFFDTNCAQSQKNSKSNLFNSYLEKASKSHKLKISKSIHKKE